MRLDHHCPWVNNCVAIFNQKSFLLFLFYTCLMCLYSGTMLVARFFSCTRPNQFCSMSAGQTIMCVLNFVEAIIFGLFVMIMMGDQFSAIFDNTPLIDAKQNKRGEKRSRMDSLISVFGERLSYRWLLPLPPTTQLLADFEAQCQDVMIIQESLPLKHTSIFESPHHDQILEDPRR
eukprot:TRINITY_DN7319_c0_g1_i8.p1 TRINITY_DN7319_c0_g1~~TRINITY_DN7319_c0_g1_i8.p1  ORF type:complete len:176 (+),score=37.52 TRINITY_DN7319_c0_g1_i8:128-655(+)